MAIDPSKFHHVNVTDTCAVWNLLSSARLYSAAKNARCEFCITGFVHYECLIKKRGTHKATDSELMERLRRARRVGDFKNHISTIDDLQRVAQLEQRKRLGKGELSTIAFAMKINQAVMTDDQKARRLAQDIGCLTVQTTPHLYAWLIFTRHLSEAHRNTVVQQHEEMVQILRSHFDDAHEKALISMMNSTPRP